LLSLQDILKGMNSRKEVKSALISVYHKEGLNQLVKTLNRFGVRIYSTGGTQSHIEELGIEVHAVESLTSYPSILGGRVKTLHPKVFGGILSRRGEEADVAQLEQYDIPEIDLVIVDLYPFEATVKSGASEAEIIEKIDIGGISLIRAAAKNFTDVLIISSREQYSWLEKILSEHEGCTQLEHRKMAALKAFRVSSAYDRHISDWLAGDYTTVKTLRYGENPHQKAHFEGNLNEVFTQLSGKELSYNNLLDIDAALKLMNEFPSGGCAILKHNNACGAAIASHPLEAYRKALQADPISAFGGILIFNTLINLETAAELDTLFFEVLLAPGFEPEALECLTKKKNRILLQTHPWQRNIEERRSAINGMLVQEADLSVEQVNAFTVVTEKAPSSRELSDLEFASILVKNTKSNAIVLVKDKQMLASGTGQTSRVDALNQAIDKARRMGLDINGAAMASDAFFPFPDCVTIAAQQGVTAVIQPGGSIKDQESIDAANKASISMVTTGIRHFKH
jgi:phosphoribosylaminoimidazolecarboxamide formyltransferase/IMP cyclohydrolase